jgi:serine O-acetyltransferase
MNIRKTNGKDKLWDEMIVEIACKSLKEPILASFFHATLLNHNNMEAALSYHLASKLDSYNVPAMLIREIMEDAYIADPKIMEATRADIKAVRERDPSCDSYTTPFLYFKGFHALQAYRVANWLWRNEREEMALFLQNQISVVFAVDIHPAAVIGKGIMIDHATGLVVGETCVIEDNVSLMQSVTLGGTGKDSGDRHPKVREGVLISAGAKILGNVEIGVGAKVGSGSVVLDDVPAHTTVAGVPAKIVGKPANKQPSRDMCQHLK